MKKWIYGSLCIVWMLVIFSFSAAPGAESTTMSDGVVASLIHWIPFLENNEMTTFIVRKLAHVSEYALLGVFVYMFLSTFALGNRIWLFAIGWIVLYACTDEIHQLFIAGREGHIRDVCIDTAGGMVGIIATWLWFTIGTVRSKRKAGK